MRLRIYVAGPITKGDQFLNVRAALDAGSALLALGHVPFVPHLTCFWHITHPNEYETWMAYDSAWIDVCQGVLRIPGESAGADREVAQAARLGLPVWYRLDDVPIAVLVDR